MTEFGSRRDFIKLAGLGAAAATLPFPALPATLAAPPVTTVDMSQPVKYRIGKWLPSDQAVLTRWLNDHIAAVEANPAPLHPVIQEFKELIEGDPELYMLFTQMYQQIPPIPVGDYLQMLRLVNAVMTRAPVFNKTGLVGFPINAILDWQMATPAGISAFLDDRVNAQFKKILDTWGRFLSSPASRYVLNADPKSGWFGRDALAAMPHFAQDYRCDPSRPYYGFVSWDDFFTRQFRPGRRPVAAPNDNAVLVNACESAPYRIARHVKAIDSFWIKGQPYSLRHMFAGDPVYEQFIDGTIYQAFLSALSYHRWHSPVNGTVVNAYVVDGSYYSETAAVGFDPAAPNESQAYITEVATRAIVLIEADDPRIGLMCFMAVGMAEVSTCDISVQIGQNVAKGEEIGMFHFGGSTHCLIFRPEVSIAFNLHGQKPGLESSNINVNAVIARVS
jgi:phosphatidylserine decarboxylase